MKNLTEKKKKAKKMINRISSITAGAAMATMLYTTNAVSYTHLISKILHMGCAKSGFQAKHLANTIKDVYKRQLIWCSSLMPKALQSNRRHR